MNTTQRFLCHFCFVLALPSVTQASEPVELMATLDPHAQYYQLMMSVKESGHHGLFVVDTGSTGIRGSAHFFGLTDQEKTSACVKTGYSSSGYSYAGYRVKRTISLHSPNGNMVSVPNIPVMAVVQSCKKGVTAECGVETAPNGCTNTPHVSMMGVGFQTYAQAKQSPVSPKNAFLNIAQMAAGTLPRTYLAGPAVANGLPFTLGVEAGNLPPFKSTQSFALTGTGQGASALVGPQGQIVIMNSKTGEVLYPAEGGLPTRLLPDTGIGYGIVSVLENKAPCCVDTAVKCRSSKNTFPPDTTVLFYGSQTAPSALTSIDYTSNARGTGQCLRWSLQGKPRNPKKPTKTPLFNSGKAFFGKCALLYAPENNTMQIGCNP